MNRTLSSNRKSALPWRLWTLVLLVLPSVALGQEVSVPVTGRSLEVTLANGQRVRGELIEVTAGSLLLSGMSGFATVELDEVSQIRARRHNMTGKRVLTWVGIGALATGAGMTLACGSLDEEDGSTNCGGVFPAIVLAWGVIGGLTGLAITSSGWQDLPVGQERLTPYARFPQGAPDGFSARRPPERMAPGGAASGRR